MTMTERSWNDFEPADLGQEIARTVEQMISERDERIRKLRRALEVIRRDGGTQSARIADDALEADNA